MVTATRTLFQLLLVVIVLLMSQILVHLLHQDLPITIDLHHLSLNTVWLERELVLFELLLLHPVLPIATSLSHPIAETLP